MSIINLILPLLDDYKSDDPRLSKFLELTESLGYADISEKIFHNLAEIIENDPAVIVKHFADLLSSDIVINNYLIKTRNKPRKANGRTSTLPEQIDEISLFWESPKLFSFLSTVLSNRGLKFHDEQAAILKPFRQIELDHNLITQLREIRNCNSHMLDIKNGYIYNNKGVKVIAINKLPSITEKLDSFINWYVKVLGSLIITQPKFAALLSYTAYSEYLRNKDGLMGFMNQLEEIPAGKIEGIETPNDFATMEIPDNFITHLKNYFAAQKVKAMGAGIGQRIQKSLQKAFSFPTDEVFVFRVAFFSKIVPLLKQLHSMSIQFDEKEKNRILAFTRLMGHTTIKYIKSNEA